GPGGQAVARRVLPRTVPPYLEGSPDGRPGPSRRRASARSPEAGRRGGSSQGTHPGRRRGCEEPADGHEHPGGAGAADGRAPGATDETGDPDSPEAPTA